MTLTFGKKKRKKWINKKTLWFWCDFWMFIRCSHFAVPLQHGLSQSRLQTVFFFFFFYPFFFFIPYLSLKSVHCTEKKNLFHYRREVRIGFVVNLVFDGGKINWYFLWHDSFIGGFSSSSPLFRPNVTWFIFFYLKKEKVNGNSMKEFLAFYGRLRYLNGPAWRVCCLRTIKSGFCGRGLCKHLTNRHGASARAELRAGLRFDWLLCSAAAVSGSGSVK